MLCSTKGTEVGISSDMVRTNAELTRQMQTVWMCLFGGISSVPPRVGLSGLWCKASMRLW